MLELRGQDSDEEEKKEEVMSKEKLQMGRRAGTENVAYIVDLELFVIFPRMLSQNFIKGSRL